jgi:hypothetical protein
MPTRTPDQPGIGAPSKPTVEVDGLIFRDLDGSRTALHPGAARDA